MGWKILLTDIAGKHTTEQRIDKPVIRIGREPGNEIVINHPRISRLHFSLFRKDNHCFLQDSSRNGVMVKSGANWVKLTGEIGLLPPVQVLLPDWAIEAEWLADQPQVVEEEQLWDQSVVIPAGRLAQKREAILVFDLCESSIIASRDDHMAYHLKLRLSQIAEPLLIEHNRRFFKSTGDGFLATFASCNNALIATAQIEERIQQRNLKTSNAPIHYRLALHYGDTWAITTGGEDIHGHDVNVTFRIEGVQEPSFADPKINFPVRDRILCSEMFLKALRSETGGAGGFQVLPCGSAALKGIEMPVAIHWVVTRFSDQATVRSAAVSPSA